MSLIWIVNILSVFFLCVFFAGIVIPQILLIAFRRRLFDEPDERKIHQCVVPRLGAIPQDQLTDEQRPYYNYTCQPGDFIKTCSVPSPLLNEKDLEREKRMLEI